MRAAAGRGSPLFPPVPRGAVLGLLAAALFGLSAPVSKRLVAAASPQVLAGLLYLGAGVGLSLYRRARPSTREARLQRSDAGRLFAVIALGGALGPVLLLVGLRRVTGVVGSLLLNLEAPFTILMAVWLFREHLGLRGGLGGALIIGGAAILGMEPGTAPADLWGSLCIAAACACWALDNNLTQQLSVRDPLAIVQLKALAAGGLNLVLGLALGDGFPARGVVLAALVVGSLSYGVSVVLAVYSLRLVGAAREAAYFATGPFFGALASTVILGERIPASNLFAMGTMAAGVAMMLHERHQHEHSHEVMEHEHVHVHDEHHQHEHTATDPPGEPHAHRHRHVPLVHDHRHVSDLHHRHPH